MSNIIIPEDHQKYYIIKEIIQWVRTDFNAGSGICDRIE